MTNEFQSILGELFKTRPDTIRTELTPLTDVVLEHPEYSDEAFEALSVAISCVLQDDVSASPVSQAIITLAPYHPEAALDLLEPVARMTAHQKVRVRANGYRCLGVLGTFESADTAHIADSVSNGLSDNHVSVQRAALWSLTKIGLANSEALSPVQSDLINCLDTDLISGGSEYEAGTIRKYATEALTVHAANTDVDTDALDSPLLEANEPKRVAAWAIQMTAQEIGVQDIKSDQLYGIKETDQDHLIAKRLAEQLRCQALDDTSDLAVASTLALGYICPRNWNIRGGVWILNTLIDKTDGRRSRAARVAIETGPFTPTHSSTDDHFDEIEVHVKAPETPTLSGNSTDVPYDLNTSENLFSPQTDLSVWGATSAQTVVGVRRSHGHERTIAADECCRENLGVEPGDTVIVSPVRSRPARTITITVPDEIELDNRLFRTQSVVFELAVQSFTEGDYLALDFVVDEKTIQHLLSDSVQNRGRVEGELDRHTLPLKVEAVTPANATTIVPGTEITVKTESQLQPTWANTETLRDSEFLCPMPLASANIVGTVSPPSNPKQTTPREVSIFDDQLS